MSKKTKKPAYESTLHASTFDAKPMALLVKHLAHAEKSRPRTKIALDKVPFIRKQFADAKAKPLTNMRVKWLIRLCTCLNNPRHEDCREGKGYQPRGTKTLVTALRACLTAK